MIGTRFAMRFALMKFTEQEICLNGLAIQVEAAGRLVTLATEYRRSAARAELVAATVDRAQLGLE